MKIIPLTKGYVARVDDKDYKRVSLYKWYSYKDPKNGVFYAVRNVQRPTKRTTEKMHRFILELTNPRIKVDHKDGDGLNNQRYNLRKATVSQNAMNARKRSVTSSQFKGVTWNKQQGKWWARINCNGKCIFLGQFIKEKEAAKAYDTAARWYFGKFAHKNFGGAQ